MNAADRLHQAMVGDNFFKRTIADVRAQRDFARNHWFASLVWAAVVAVGGWVLADVYNAWKPWADNDDTRLDRIREEQAAAFKNLDAQLDKLGRTVDGSGKTVLRDVEGLVKDIRQTNTGLLHQLVLARAEYDRLSQVSGSQGGVSGGYDLILTQNTGMNVDASTVVGVGDIRRYGVRVRVTADGMEGKNEETLNSGESIAYRGADGKPCRVTLLSFTEAAASFDVACGQG